MNDFELSAGTDEKRNTFLVNMSFVESRLDPYYYSPRFKWIMQLETLSVFPLVKISTISHFVTDGIHEKPNYSDEGLPFIQANNIKEGNINFSKNIKLVDDTWRKKVLKGYTPKSGDVLVTKDGTIGVAATVPDQFESFSIFVSVLAIRPKLDAVIPEFLRIMISSKIVQEQIARSTKGAVLSHLLLKETRELKIPLPSKTIQNQIVAKMNVAYADKKEKDEDAQTLIDNIDNYLLSELDVYLPDIKEDTINERTFKCSLRSLSGNRFDASFYTMPKREFFSKLSSSKYAVKLGSIIADSSYGVLPPGDSYDDGLPIMFLRATDLRPNLLLETANSLRISEKYYKQKRARLRDGDILLAVKGATIASKKSVAYIEKAPKSSMINGSIFRFQLTRDQNPKYVSYLLDSFICKRQMKYNLVANNAVDYLDKTLIYNLLLPLPSLKKQNEIVGHINEIRTEAKQLQKESAAGLERAKAEVEAMILGDTP